MLLNLAPAEVLDALACRDGVVLVDVREPAEHGMARIAAATLIPLHLFSQRLAASPRERETVPQCHQRMRSEMAGDFLVAQGCLRMSQLVGGIDPWSRVVDSTIPRS